MPGAAVPGPCRHRGSQGARCPGAAAKPLFRVCVVKSMEKRTEKHKKNSGKPKIERKLIQTCDIPRAWVWLEIEEHKTTKMKQNRLVWKKMIYLTNPFLAEEIDDRIEPQVTQTLCKLTFRQNMIFSWWTNSASGHVAAAAARAPHALPRVPLLDGRCPMRAVSQMPFFFSPTGEHVQKLFLTGSGDPSL